MYAAPERHILIRMAFPAYFRNRNRMLPAVKKCLYRVRIPVIFAMAVAAVMFIVHGRCQIGWVYQKRQFFAGPKGLADTLTVTGQAILITPQGGLPFRNTPHIVSAMASGA